MVIRLKDFVLFAIVIVLAFSVSISNAETQSLAQSQAEDEAGIKAAKEEQAILEANNDLDYRQRLKKLITVTEEEKEELPQAIDSYVRYMPSRGVDAMSGKVEMVDSSTEYSYELKAFGKLPVEFGVGIGYIGINNSTAVKLPSSLTTVGFGVGVTLPFFKLEKTYLRLDVRPSFYADKWHIRSSAFRLPLRLFSIYQPSDKLTCILGVAGFPEFEDEVAPIVGFIYKPNDKLAFNMIPPTPNINYSLNEKIDLFTEFGASDEEFEVTKDDIKNTVLIYREQHLGAGVRYKLNKFITTSVSVGGMFNRYFRYRDSLGKVDVKDGLYTEFRVEASF
jgi:hypothetical protein